MSEVDSYIINCAFALFYLSIYLFYFCATAEKIKIKFVMHSWGLGNSLKIITFRITDFPVVPSSLFVCVNCLADCNKICVCVYI